MNINSSELMRTKQNKYLILYFILLMSLLILTKGNSVLLVIVTLFVLLNFIAYYYPSLSIILLVIFGQILQFEFEEIVDTSKLLSFGDFNFRLSDPILFALIISILMKFITKEPDVFRSMLTNTKYLILFLLFVTAETVRNIGFYGSLTLGEFRTYYQGFVILFYISVSFRKEKDREHLLRALIVLSLLQIPIALFKGILFNRLALDMEAKLLSSFASLSLLYGLLAVYISRNRSHDVINGFLSFFIYIFGLSILLIAGNRSVWLAGIIGLLSLVVLRQIKIRKQIAFIFLAVMIMLIIARLYSTHGNDFYTFMIMRLRAFTDYTQDPTASWRYLFWVATLDNIMLKPWLGWGLGTNFNIYVPELQYTLTTSPHNFYLTMLYQLGLAGTLLFILFVVHYYRQIFTIKYHTANESIIKVLVIVVFSCTLTYWLTYSTEKDFISFCFLGLGLAFSTDYDLRRDQYA